VVKNGVGEVFQKKNANSEMTFCNCFGVGVPRDFYIEKNVPELKKG